MKKIHILSPSKNGEIRKKVPKHQNAPFITHQLKGRHGTHAPFVYDFVCHVLRGPSNRKTFLGRYFFPVIHIHDLEEIYQRFLAYYKPEQTINLDGNSTSLKEIHIEKTVKSVLLVQHDTVDLDIENISESLEQWRQENIKIAYWLKSETLLENWYLYFNRAIKLKGAILYFNHSEFLEKELFHLK